MRPRIAVVTLATFATTIGLLTGVDAGGAGAGVPRTPASSSALAAPDPPYFKDRIGGTGKPVFIFSAEDWGLLPNGGLNNSGNANLTYDNYFTARAAQGYNGVEVSIFNYTGLFQGKDGPDWDNTYPFTPGTDPTTAPNQTFWARRDHFISAAASHGFYVFLNITTPYLGLGAFTASWSNAQWAAFGAFLAGRYAGAKNIYWIVGDDYFGTVDSGLAALKAALRAGGANQPISIQNYQESSSRRDIYSGGPPASSFGAGVDYNWGYSYNATYDVVEKMGLENSTMTPIPYMFADGTFLNTGMSGITEKDFARRMIWWALSSGSKGFNLGDNDMWPWDPSAYDEIAGNTFYTKQIPAIMAYWRSLPDWQRLIADTSSRLVTGGRGRHISPIPSGGSATALTDNSDSYVTASRTPDGTLAVIYMSHRSTITIDESTMLSGYKATWVDPASGATRAATPGPRYDSSSQGSNSAGDTDWVLVLKANAPHSAGRLKGKGRLTPRSWVRRDALARLHARFGITYACSTCRGPKRPIKIEGRLPSGAWRTIQTLTYRHSKSLKVSVSYKFRRVRVVAPALSTDAHAKYTKVVSNSIRVPRKPR
jgi:hypothetical protein